MIDDKETSREDLEKEIIDLKIRLKRIEEMLKRFPSPSDYIESQDGYEINYDGLDPLFDEVVKLVTQYDTASASFIQRRMSVGYSRAARILDQLEEKGIVGHAEGSIPRKVLKNNSTEE